MKAVEGWKQISIGEFVDLINGFAFPSEGFTEGEGKPLIRIRDLERQKTEVNFRGKYNYCYLVKKDDLLIGMDGDFQTVKWKGSDALLNQRVCKLITKSPKVLVHDFLFYRIIEEILHIHRITAATTVKHLSSKDVLGIVIDLPPKPEQAKIAEILSTVDRAIEQTEALIAKQQRIKTGLMQDLLTRGIDEQGNLRSEQTHEFKDSPMGRIPVEWEVKYLMEIVAITEGQQDPKRGPYRDWLLVAPDHIESKSGLLLTKKTAREQGAISGKYEFGCRDVVYSKIRPYLRKAVLVDFNGLCSADMYPLRPKEGVRSEFVLMTILGERFSRYAESVSERSGFPKINRKELSEFQVALPSESEQNRMATLAKELSTSSVHNKKHLSKLCSLKTALMQDLLTGKKRVILLLKQEATSV
jgi:type I restriction enzyme S subunit